MRLLFGAVEKISIAAWVTRGAIVDPMDEASQLHDNRLKNAATRVRCTRFKEISSIAPGDDNWRLARDPAILQHRLMWRWWPQGAFVSSVSRSVDNGGMEGGELISQSVWPPDLSLIERLFSNRRRALRNKCNVVGKESNEILNAKFEKKNVKKNVKKASKYLKNERNLYLSNFI